MTFFQIPLNGILFSHVLKLHQNWEVYDCKIVALAFIAANTVSKKILAEIVIRLVVLLIIAYVITFFLMET